MRVRRSSRDRSESREERKERTRRRLMEAALDLMGDERTFTALSLRRVARRAGISPNAFYRHFDDMEDLGLALLDDIGPTLRRLLREVRKAGISEGEMVRRSVAVYLSFVREHRKYFTFIVRERAGGSPKIREGIRRDMGYFASELAADITELTPEPIRPSERAMQLLADLIVEVMLSVATEILDLPDDPEREREVTDHFVDRIIVIILGAVAWDPKRRQHRSGVTSKPPAPPNVPAPEVRTDADVQAAAPSGEQSPAARPATEPESVSA